MRIYPTLTAFIFVIGLLGCTTAPSQEIQGMVIGGVNWAVLGSTVGDGRVRVLQPL